MNEQLIEFETAKIAKEKGFDWECLYFYCKNKTCHYLETPYRYSFDVNANQKKEFNDETDNFGFGLTWSAPTQSLLQKWLRDVHNVDIVSIPVRFTGHLNIGYWTYSIQGEQPVGKQKYKFNTFEQALEIGLLKALTLI